MLCWLEFGVVGNSLKSRIICACLSLIENFHILSIHFKYVVEFFSWFYLISNFIYLFIFVISFITCCIQSNFCISYINLLIWPLLTCFSRSLTLYFYFRHLEHVNQDLPYSMILFLLFYLDLFFDCILQPFSNPYAWLVYINLFCS